MNLGIGRRFTTAGVLAAAVGALADSAKISLLATPALGCIQSFSERWKPQPSRARPVRTT